MANVNNTSVTRANRTSIFNLAWRFVKQNGFSLSEALKVAWANFKLKIAMATRIVKFYFQKVDGSIREAYGTLDPRKMPQTQGTGRKPSETVQVYWDCEREAYRCFKKANLIGLA